MIALMIITFISIGVATIPEDSDLEPKVSYEEYESMEPVIVPHNVSLNINGSY